MDDAQLNQRGATGTAVSVSDLSAPGKRSDGAPAMEVLPCAGDGISIWRLRLDVDEAHVDDLARLLSSDELQRSDRFSQTIDRNRYIFTRTSLRQLLGRYLSVEPATLEFAYTPRGKPYLQGAGLPHFNVSHSGNIALLAICSNRPVGVDIEHLDRDVDFAALASRFFSAGECIALSALPAHRQKRAFLTGWTRKESILKATGDGLALPLNQFEVNLDPEVAPRIVATTLDRVAKCTLHALQVGTEYAASVATFDESRA